VNIFMKSSHNPYKKATTPIHTGWKPLV